MATSQEKMKSLFEDLGKPTLRGVRKCPKCGTYNGTRGISCKNKQCDVVFKEKEKKKSSSCEAVKIVTGSTVQVFSVRLRDRGPDYRGFVQLPLVQDIDGNPAPVVDVSILASAARCYVDSCSRSSQLGDPETCPHVKAAIECTTEAQPLTLKNSVLNSLQVSNDIKQAIWLLATETTGPLVQRVSKNIMVVKCKPNPKQPLGFLHFAFFESVKGKSQIHRFQCTCKSQKVTPKSGEDMFKRCVHFYACVCAFASDEKLQEEFAFYLDLNSGSPATTVTTELPAGMRVVEEIIPTTEIEEQSQEQLITVYETEIHEQHQDTLEVVVPDELLETPSKKKRKEEIVQASSALLTLQESNVKPGRILSTSGKQTPHKTLQTPVSKKPANPFSVTEEVDVVATFQSWLASVTERINQTMHYQFDGNPDPLVFHAPQFFFDCLQVRISSGYKKKRLPNFTTAFVRKDALPLGTFTKYTWHITNILHVKQIFDTPEMPLEITRNFVENRDLTYDLYEIPRIEDIGDKNQMPIRPFELKTFLKVGNTHAEQRDPTPFIIEWIPDILPKSHIGELRIKFEYGHQRNGHIEHRGSDSSPLGPVSINANQQLHMPTVT